MPQLLSYRVNVFTDPFNGVGSLFPSNDTLLAFSSSKILSCLESLPEIFIPNLGVLRWWHDDDDDDDERLVNLVFATK